MILFFSHLKSKLAVLQCDAASQNVALTFVKTSLTKTKYILNFKSKRTIAEKTPHVNTGIIQVIWSHPPKLQKRVLKKKKQRCGPGPLPGPVATKRRTQTPTRGGDRRQGSKKGPPLPRTGWSRRGLGEPDLPPCPAGIKAGSSGNLGFQILPPAKRQAVIREGLLDKDFNNIRGLMK